MQLLQDDDPSIKCPLTCPLTGFRDLDCDRKRGIAVFIIAYLLYARWNQDCVCDTQASHGESNRRWCFAGIWR
ncbi:hypothetical protein BJX65DRAFT_272994 [Aspergillus insuetus]